jgi:predicted lipoprotein with Yx(FWY)xxD motif
MTMNKMMLTTLSAAIVATAAANFATAQTIAFNNGVMTDSAGRTLYTFDKDSANKSNCNSGCAAAWPPFFAKDGASANTGFSITTRDDGAKQWAMNGKPLYYFAPDTKAGDIKGDGEGGVWHVIRNADKRAEPQPAARPAAGAYGSYGSYGQSSGY